MNKRLYQYSLIACTLFASTVKADHKVERREPTDLCEAIEQGKQYAYDNFVQYQDINSCKDARNLDEDGKAVGAVVGLFMLPLAPLIWYGTLHESTETPLSTAVWNKQNDMVDDLLQRGAHVNKQDSLGYTPLHWACSAFTSQSSYLDLAKKLLEHGAQASLSIKDNKGRLPLHWAYVKGNDNIADMLISYGSPTNVSDKEGKTPLDYKYERDMKHTEH